MRLVFLICLILSIYTDENDTDTISIKEIKLAHYWGSINLRFYNIHLL